MVGLSIAWQRWRRRGGLTLAAVAGVLALMTGCVVGPDYVRPTVIAPAAYKEVDGWKAARVQDEAVQDAQRSVTLTTNQYKAGTVSYLNVITAQTTALTNETTAVQIRGRRMAAAVLLIQTLGGGWHAADLPSTQTVTEREQPAEPK
jgi:Outer membrane efflux protein